MMDWLANNSYRILGLPVKASKRDAVRRMEEIQALVSIGKTPQYYTDFPWIDALERNDESVKNAVRMLDNPSKKLEQLLFWFWIIDEVDEKACSALKKRKIKKAIQIWTTPSHRQSIHYKKNIIMLEQILTFQDRDNAGQHLRKSIELWSELAQSEKLFDFIQSFDPTLSRKLSDDILTSCISNQINQIAKPLLKEWSTINDSDAIREFLTTLNQSGLPTKIVVDVEDNFCGPLIEQIDKLYNEFSEKHLPYSHLYEEIRKFHNKIKPFFVKLKLCQDSYLIESYGDKIGSIILNRAIEYGNNAGQWRECKYLIELSSIFIQGTLLRDRFEENLNTVVSNAEQEKVERDLFARANEEKSYAGLWVGLIIVIIIIAALAGSSNNNSSTNSTNSPSGYSKDTSYSNKSYSNTSSSNSQPYVTDAGKIDSLNRKIDDNKKRLKILENQLNSELTSLESYEKNMQSLKGDLENAERKFANGIYVSEYQYNRSLNKYNNLIEKYNKELLEFKERYGEYEKLLNSTNTDVKEYNRLIRAN